MDFERGAVVVCGAASLRAHTPEAVPIVSDLAATGAADVVLVEDGVTVGPGWLDGLLAARGSDGTVATVSAVTAEHPGRADGPLRPRAFAPMWGCVLVTRAALELCGPLDEGFPARASAAGLLHVLADDVIVAPERPDPEDDSEPATRARARTRALSGELAVTIDARILRDPVAGTQVHTLELLAALHRTGALRLRVLLDRTVTDTARALLDSLDGLEYVAQADVVEAPTTAVVHRPYQVSSAPDLLTLRHVGERLVVTHQDLLGFHNPAYHADRDTWLDYRRLTRAALVAAHRVVAFSHHAAADLAAEGLVGPERLRVVHIGVDHRLGELTPAPRVPTTPPPTPYLLCLGTDLRHKNRPFALRLLQALHGWEGALVLAGPPAGSGSSAAEEAEILAADPALAGRVIHAGTPDEAEKAWLYAHAAAVVYPTTYEGFGLIPFEAAAHGVPCLFAPQGALAETLAEAATLVPWDAAASAARVRPLLDAGPERTAHVERIRTAAERFTWDATARALLPIYAETLRAARRPLVHARGRGGPARVEAPLLVAVQRHRPDRPVAGQRRRAAAAGGRAAHAGRARPPPRHPQAAARRAQRRPAPRAALICATTGVRGRC